MCRGQSKWYCGKLFTLKKRIFPPPKIKKAGRAGSRQMLNPPREWGSRVDEEAGGGGAPSQGSPEEGPPDLPAGRIPMCCWPSNTKLPMGWPSGLYAAPWLTEGSRRKPDCGHSRTQRRKKKRYTKQSAIVPWNVTATRWLALLKGGVIYRCISTTELRWVSSFNNHSGEKTSPASLTGGSSSLFISQLGEVG